MQKSRYHTSPGITFSILVSLLVTCTLFAQTPAQKNLQFKFTPATLQLEVEKPVEVTIELLDADGNLVPTPFLLYARGQNRQARRALSVEPRRSDDSGKLVTTITAHRPGTFRLNARTASYRRDERFQADIPIDVAFPPLEKITFISPRQKLYAGTTVSYQTRVFDAAKLERADAEIKLSSQNQAIASFDPYGNLTAHKPGKTALIAEAENVREKLDIQVVANPVASLDLTGNMAEARTGDVIHFSAVARDAIGKAVDDAPISFTFKAKPEDNLGPAASGQIEDDGRFVAETPGLYTIMANSGSHSHQLTIKITPRNVQKKIQVLGHGLVKVFTSDLWVWQGVDGRDYAVTGTHRANGEAYFWDVTDPTNLTIIDTVTVDARTVNDVKLSEDGRICVISREGASNRKNGIVILDVTNPREVKILSRYDDELTGGVHNVFIYENHVYAVNNGQRYDVINIEDPTKPYRVGRFELETPGHGVHDVWIEDGIAYSSNWQDGVQLVDVGGVTSGAPFRKFGETASQELAQVLGSGGSPSNPLQFGNYEYPSGWNHAAFPYRSETANKFYVILGDEAGQQISPYADEGRENVPPVMAGWFHFVDFTNPRAPKEVARFEIPDAGAHNLWAEDDILYAAYYNGGMRVVDISGELMGNLFRQGREIARFLPTHPDGPVPNAPFVWGPQPYKGNIFLVDYNSGLWCVKLVPIEQEGTN